MKKKISDEGQVIILILLIAIYITLSEKINCPLLWEVPALMVTGIGIIALVVFGIRAEMKERKGKELIKRSNFYYEKNNRAVKKRI